MARKGSPILGRAWDLIALSISPMAKMKKPIRRKLLLFKRSKRFKLLKHYNYAFIGEYEFSPSSTPLFRHPRSPLKKKSCFFLSLLCGGNGSESIAEGGIEDEWEILPACVDGAEQEPSELSESGEDDDSSSVDQRAEKFIERFYQEMRVQRQESIMQYMEMLDRSS